MKPDLNENLVATVFRTIGMYEDGCNIAVIQQQCDVLERELWDAVEYLKEGGVIQRRGSNWVYTPQMQQDLLHHIQHGVKGFLD